MMLSLDREDLQRTLWANFTEPRIHAEMTLYATRVVRRHAWKGAPPDAADILHDAFLHLFEETIPVVLTELERIGAALAEAAANELADLQACRRVLMAKIAIRADDFRIQFANEILNCVRRHNRRHTEKRVTRVGDFSPEGEKDDNQSAAIKLQAGVAAEQGQNLEWRHEFYSFMQFLESNGKSDLQRYATAVLELDCAWRFAHQEIAKELQISVTQSHDSAKRLRRAYRNFLDESSNPGASV